jgi:integral membrane protein (TIGR01906 family)
MNKTLQTVITWVIALMVPFFLLISSMRAVFIPPLIQVEYRMPGFPPDVYGFTVEERLQYARVSLDYLFNNAGIEYLAQQKLPDGSSLYNERELSHMADVKVFFHKVITVWWFLFGILAALGIGAVVGKWLPVYINGLGTGGKLTIGLIVFLLMLVAVSFDQLFTFFHRLFFTGDSWLFNYSDSLIRLFPERLWSDVFIAVGVLTLALSGLFIWLQKKYGQR